MESFHTGAARPGMPLPQPITLQTPQGPPGGYPPQQGQLRRPTYHHGPGPAPDQGPYRSAPGPAPIQGPHRAAGHPNGPPAPAYAPVPAHRRFAFHHPVDSYSKPLGRLFLSWHDIIIHTWLTVLNLQHLVYLLGPARLVLA